jgi:RNA polymerase sigma factor (sigma-70 family)
MIELLNAVEITKIFELFKADKPEPKTELIAPNDFTLLVSVVLSAQATDKSVNKATAPLYAAADTPEKILSLGEDGLREYIKTIGLYRVKARHVIALCQMLIEKYNSKVPLERTALESLPGVGRKTANVILKVSGTSILSLNDVWYSGDDSDHMSIGDSIEAPSSLNPDVIVEREEIRRVIIEAINELPEKEKMVLVLYYHEDMTFKEIGQVLEVSESRISQLHTKANLRLRAKLTNVRKGIL